MIIRFLLLLLTGIMALSSVSAVSHYGIVQEQAPTDDKNTDDTDDADNQPDDPDDSKKQVPNEIDHEASADDELAGGDTADEASDDSTADVGEVEQAPAVPTAEILILWASPPKDEYEVEAAKLYDIRYIDRCSNRKYCEETRKIVTDDLAGLLLEYIARSLTKRGHDTPTRADAPNAVDYTVFQGQKIELLSGKPGANDAELWGHVTRLVPLAQADRLIGKFQVFSNL